MPNKFGGYDYDANNVVIQDSDKSNSAKLRQGDRLGEPGGYTGGGIRAAGRASITGVVLPSVTGTPNIRERYREFEAAHQPGTPRPLRLDYYGETFVWAEPAEGGIVEIKGSPSPFIGARAFEVSFYLSDPYTYQNQEQGPQNLTLSNVAGLGDVTQLGSTNIFNGGRAYAEPTINFFVSSAGTVAIIHDKGRFELFANLPGTYSVNSRERFVSRNTALYHYRWDGEMPQIKPGQTSITLQTTYGAASAASARWFNRD